MEYVLQFVEYVANSGWAQWGAKFFWAIIGVAIVDIIKHIVCAVLTKKGLEVNKKKYEIALVASAFVCAFGLSFGFFYCHATDLPLWEAFARAGASGALTTTAYTFVAQPTRKGIKGLINGAKYLIKKFVELMVKLFNKAKGGKITLNTAIETINEVNGEVQVSAIDKFLQHAKDLNK